MATVRARRVSLILVAGSHLQAGVVGSITDGRAGWLAAPVSHLVCPPERKVALELPQQGRRAGGR